MTCTFLVGGSWVGGRVVGVIDVWMVRGRGEKREG